MFLVSQCLTVPTNKALVLGTDPKRYIWATMPELSPYLQLPGIRQCDVLCRLLLICPDAVWADLFGTVECKSRVK